MKFQEKGTVFFVGAGPGDPSLLTVKAARILALADVVIVDRLVSEGIITEFVNSSAEIIPVGKQGGSEASTSQKEINELLCSAALRHKAVVRLKGGDVSLFSNILDELQALNDNGIHYEIVPGITALSGAAAYTGIPLTARGLSTGVRILTYYKSSAVSDDAWQELATLKDTLVFYMSANALHEVVSKLLEAGAEPLTPFVVIEQATTPNQYVHQFTLQQFHFMQEDFNFVSPSLVIIGKVIELYNKFAWLPETNDRTPYFTPLEAVTRSLDLITEYQK